MLLGFDEPSSLGDTLLHTLLFIPLGFGLACLMQNHKIKRLKASVLIIIAVTVLSVVMEILQSFIPSRSPSFTEILANIFGAFLGFLIFRLWGNKLLNTVSVFVESFRKWFSKKKRLITLLCYATFICLFAVVLEDTTSNATALINWDLTYPLLIGNEQTGNRAWQGQVFDLIIVNKALSEPEINEISSEPRLLSSSENSVIALYRFDQNITYRDQTDFLPNLSWKKNFLEFTANANPMLTSENWLESIEPPIRLAQELENTSQFSLITHVATADLTQTGPARIVSYSWDIYHRNFTLGQQESNLVFRLRTPLTGENGTNPELTVPDIFIDTLPHQLVVTYDGSTIRVYVDGILQSSLLKLKPTPGAMLFGQLLPLATDHVGQLQIMYYTFIFVPFAFLLTLVSFVVKQNVLLRFIVLFIGAILFPVLLEIIFVSLTNRPVSILNLASSLAIMTAFTIVFTIQAISWLRSSDAT